MYRNASIFVFPTLNEAFGLALLEAMAASLPIVASSEGGIPDIIEDGQTGLLVPTGRVEPLAAAISTLIRDPAMRTRLGSAARARYEEKYTIDVFEANICSTLMEFMRKCDPT
jgi:glycosyltransferase involved in cell wall biosynthesis